MVVKRSPVVLLGTTQLATVGGLGLPSEVERRLCDRKQREVSAARRSPERNEPQLALDPLDLLADPDFAVVLVDIAPAQAGNVLGRRFAEVPAQRAVSLGTAGAPCPTIAARLE